MFLATARARAESEVVPQQPDWTNINENSLVVVQRIICWRELTYCFGITTPEDHATRYCWPDRVRLSGEGRQNEGRVDTTGTGYFFLLVQIER